MRVCVWNPQLEQHLQNTTSRVDACEDGQDGSGSDNDKEEEEEEEKEDTDDNGSSSLLTSTSTDNATKSDEWNPNHQGGKELGVPGRACSDDERIRVMIHRLLVGWPWRSKGAMIMLIVASSLQLLISCLVWNSSLQWNVVMRAATNACVTITILMMCRVIKVKWQRRRCDQGRTQQYLSDLETSRRRVSAMLASIGGSPLPLLLPPAMQQQQQHHTSRSSPLPTQPTIAKDNSTDITDEMLQLLVQCCQAHVELIRQVDECIAVLQTAVSMTLHCTPTLVQRVELATLCNTTSVSSTRSPRRHGNDKSNHVALAVARRRLEQVMMNQYNLLVQAFMTLSPSHDDNDEDNINNDNNNNNTMAVPDVITLAWLKSLRHQLVDLVASQCSQLLSSSSPSTPPSSSLLRPQVVFEDALRQCTCAAIESTTYLTSMLASMSHATTGDETSTTVRRLDDSNSKELRLLCQQWNKASIALWAACQEEETILSFRKEGSCSESEREDDRDSDDGNARVLDFVEQFEQLLQSVGIVKESLVKTSSQQQHESKMEAVLDKVDCSVRPHQSVDTGDFEDVGIVVPSQSAVESTAEDHCNTDHYQFVAERKTVVFSGSGSVHRPITCSGEQRNGDEDMIANDDVTISNRHYASLQGAMLHELQKRLARMEPAEEVDASGGTSRRMNTTNESLEVSPVRERKAPTEVTSSLFLGASGDLLGELKNAIGG